MKYNFSKCDVCTGNQAGCQNCLDNPLRNSKGVTMGNLDQQFTEALGPAEELQVEEEYSYDRGYVITKSGIELTAQSQKDEAGYFDDIKTKKERQPKSNLTEAEIDTMLGIERKKKKDSLIDEAISEAFI